MRATWGIAHNLGYDAFLMAKDFISWTERVLNFVALLLTLFDLYCRCFLLEWTVV